MNRQAVAAEHRQRLVLWRGGKGEEAEIRLPAALGYAAEQLFHVLQAFFGGVRRRLFPQAFAAEDFLEVGRRLAALGAVRLVDDYRATPRRQRPRRPFPAFLRHPQQLARYEGEFLQRGDDHRHAAFERLGELARALVDLPDDALSVFELVDRVLKLLVEHHAVGDHDHAVEDPFVALVVQRRKAVGEPADSVALAAAGGMLDQVILPHPVVSRRFDQRAHGVEPGGSAGKSSIRPSPCGPGRPASPRSGDG